MSFRCCPSPAVRESPVEDSVLLPVTTTGRYPRHDWSSGVYIPIGVYIHHKCMGYPHFWLICWSLWILVYTETLVTFTVLFWCMYIHRIHGTSIFTPLHGCLWVYAPKIQWKKGKTSPKTWWDLEVSVDSTSRLLTQFFCCLIYTLWYFRSDQGRQGWCIFRS